MNKILALDLGTSTGTARHKNESVLALTMEWANPKEVTEWKKTRRTRTGDPRIARFYRWLMFAIQTEGIDHIVFEDVEFCSQTYQCQLWSSFRTCVWIAADLCGCDISAVPVGSLKKFATGKGTATKVEMAKALIANGGGRFTLKRKVGVWDTEFECSLDDNAVDALWLYSWAMENLVK